MSARQGVGRLRTWVGAEYNEHDSEVAAQDEGGLGQWLEQFDQHQEHWWWWEEQCGDSDARTGQSSSR